VDGLADSLLYPLVHARGVIVIVTTIAITHHSMQSYSEIAAWGSMQILMRAACESGCKWLHKMNHEALRV